MSQRTLIPMEVLGWLAPILAPADGVGTLRHRASLLWGLAPTAAQRCETLWLASQFPHHAEEAIDGVREAVHQKGGPKSEKGRAIAARLGPLLDRRSSPRIVGIFDNVWRRYLRWSGNQLVVRAGRMEEFHNLALLFPVSQLVHHAHARALSLGQVGRERLHELSCQPQHLPSESSALTGLTGRGLAEGHLHLGGISSAEEVWADHLLAHSAPFTERGGDPQRQRLLGEVNRLVLRLAVLALLLLDRWRAKGLSGIDLGNNIGRERCGKKKLGLRGLHRLLDELDWICTLSDFAAARDRAEAVRREIEEVVDAVLGEANQVSDGGWIDCSSYEIVGLLLAPHRFVLGRHHRFPPELRSDPRLATATHKRRAAIDWLHLELHRLLLELPAGRSVLHDREETYRRWLEPTEEEEGGGFESALESYTEKVVLRYLVLLTVHHYLGTHRGRRMGLRRFQTSFNASQRRPVPADSTSQREWRRYAAAQVRELLTHPDLRLVEGRVSPATGGRETIRPWLLGYEEAWNPSRPDAERRPWRRPREDIAFGLVVHFKKTPDLPRPPQPRGRLLEPQNLPRHHRCREITRRHAFDLFRFLRRPDPQVPFLVGIDAAGHELDSPPEVFAPAFRFLCQEPIDFRDASLLRWSLLHKRSFYRLVEGRRLGMTFHVGEDFRHLLSGLRAVWEVVRFLAPQPGDRLGHAIAIGADPTVWARLLTGQTLVPRQEWLDDLVWIWHFLGPGHDLLGELKIEDEIQRHAAIVYGDLCRVDCVSPIDLHHAWTLRSIDPKFLSLEDAAPWAFAMDRQVEELRSPRQVRRRGCGARRFRPPLATSPEEERWIAIQQQCFDELKTEQIRCIGFELHWLYLYDPEVALRGEEMLTIELGQPWLELCRLAQDRIRRELHQRQLVVEINPTSNRVIGPMAGIPDHHIFRLSRYHQDGPALAATVNTDDPGVFQVSLAHEFCLLGEELLARQEEESEVLRWLEELRQNGFNHSFLKCLKESPTAVRSAVLDDLRRLYGGWTTTRDRWLLDISMDLATDSDRRRPLVGVQRRRRLRVDERGRLGPGFGSGIGSL